MSICFGCGQAEVGHVADEIVLADRFGEARIVQLLLADARDREAAIVVAGIDEAIIRPARRSARATE